VPGPSGEYGRVVIFKNEQRVKTDEDRLDSDRECRTGQAGKVDEQAPELDAWSSFLL
jgi:hypothetical protein